MLIPNIDVQIAGYSKHEFTHPDNDEWCEDGISPCLGLRVLIEILHVLLYIYTYII